MGRKSEENETISSSEDNSSQDPKQWWIEADNEEEKESQPEWETTEDDGDTKAAHTQETLTTTESYSNEEPRSRAICDSRSAPALGPMKNEEGRDKEYSGCKRDPQHGMCECDELTKKTRVDTVLPESATHSPKPKTDGKSDVEIQAINGMVEVVSLLKSMLVEWNVSIRCQLSKWSVVRDHRLRTSLCPTVDGNEAVLL